MNSTEIMEFWKIMSFIKNNRKEFWNSICKKQLNKHSIELLLDFISIL